MLRLEAAIKILRLVSENRRPMYTFEEVTSGLDMADIGYTVEESGHEKHVSLLIDPTVKAHFTLENNYYTIQKFNIVHSLLNELTEYVNELDVKGLVSKRDFKICKQDIELQKTVGFDHWEQRKLAITKILNLFHEDEIVATFMYLKFISKCEGACISYIERHNEHQEYFGNETDMYIEIYNNEYNRTLSLDIANCDIMDNKVELIIDSFENFDIDNF